MMALTDKLKAIIKDPIKWIETFVKIVDKSGHVVSFKLNPQQRYIMRNKGKFNICLKSRQLGITSVALANTLYLTHTRANCTCMIMSYSLDSAHEIFEKLKILYTNLPESIRLKTVNNNRTELKFVNNSRIIVCTCGSKDAARGSTLTFVHMSEVAFMNENLEKQLLAIEQALTPNGSMILESTANGLNLFSEYWNKATTGESPLWKPFFFPWTKDKIMFASEYKEYADQYKEIFHSTLTKDELTDKELGLLHDGANMEQLMWRRLKISNSSEEKFCQEFPSNPTEAFVSTGSNVFSAKMIHERLGTLYTAKEKALPAKIDPILIKHRQYLKCWKLPIKKKKYFIGVDTAEGLGNTNDYSVICVLDTDGFQCAEWRSNRIKPYEFSDIVLAMAQWFNDGLLVIERASAGHTVLDKIVHDKRYHNIYKYKEYDQRGRAKRKVGWETSAKSKPMMIGDFQEWFETNQCVINSKELLEEMKLFQSKDGSYNASSGHDDTIMSYAMAIQGLKSGQYFYPWS
ncbi:MAG: hypothetical protein IKO36_00570 [Bacteroidaceae bacterium]|nr:hypothetical protein [Bacteroidaceae bacterium]